MKALLENKKILLALVVIVGAILRIDLYTSSPMYTTDGSIGYVHPDASEYLYVGQYILENGLWAYLTNEISVMLASGAPLYLTFLYTALDGNFQYMRMFGIVLSCLQILLIYKITLKLFNDFRVAVLAAFFMAVNAHIANYSYVLITETLFLLVFSISVYFYLQAREEKKSFWIYAIFSALFLAFATLTRANPMLLPLIFIGFFGAGFYFFKKDNFKAELHTWLAIGVVFYILLSPFIIRNHFMFNTNNLFTGGGTALFLGSRVESQGDEPAFYGQTYGCIYEVIGKHSHREIEADKLLYAAGIQNIKENPVEYCKMNIKKIARLTIGTNYAWFNGLEEKSIGKIQERYHNTELVIKLLCVIFLHTTVYAFATMGVFRYRKNFSLCSMILFPMYFLIFSLPFLAILRYGVIIYIFAAIWAAVEIVAICKDKNYLRGGLGLSASLAMFFYICAGY